MITITLSQALALYAAVIGIGAIFIYAYTGLTVQRRLVRIERQHLWRCVFCTYTYLDETAEAISKCPRCGSFNSLEDHQAKFVPSGPHAKDMAHPVPSGFEETPRRNPSKGKRSGKRRGPRRRSR
ncbi:MAG: hypothetical protein ACLFTT_00445 [Candidatus Hydrogenedentota bacterium]